MPWYYKVGALWGGQEGSLLFWCWILTLFSMVTVLVHRKRNPVLMPWVVGVVAMVTTFFLLVNNFVANPFDAIGVSQAGQAPVPWAPPDGQGLNPLLQYWAMVIHPPILYVGYVGFTIPFAFAIAALITRELDEEWIRTTRRWMMVPWLFLGTGILLGAMWAYVVLGWGGYWGWDPVENASLMPWLTGTAFLHSVIMQERKGMMKVWNMVLILATFLLCILGTFLTRSGIVSSVHSFAQSPIGPFFSTFLILMTALSLYCLFTRMEELKSENRLDSVGFQGEQLPVQQFGSVGDHLCRVVGDHLSDPVGMGHQREKNGGGSLLQPGQHPHRAVPALPDRRRTLAGLEKNLPAQPEEELHPSAGGRAGCGTAVRGLRDAPLLCDRLPHALRLRIGDDSDRVPSGSARAPPAGPGLLAVSLDPHLPQHPEAWRLHRARGHGLPLRGICRGGI